MLTDKRKSQIAIIALRQRIKNEKIPYLNSPEMRERIKKTLEIPELQKLEVSKEELEEFIVEVLSE